MTAFEINSEILLQVAILELDGLKPYIVEMPLEYGQLLMDDLQPHVNINLKMNDKWRYMNMKVYFGGKSINVCAKAYKS
jgi:hypothetical protein